MAIAYVKALNSLMSNSYFASGTGAAGLVGAFLWWELRHLGVQTGVGISAVRQSLEIYTFLCG